MNKSVKGGIALGAGLLLLLGGGGTFALWNASTTVNAGTVTSGHLNVTGGTTGTWYHYADFMVNGDDATPLVTAPDTIADYHVVPQDDLIFVTDDAIEVTAEGGELYYTFGASGYTASAGFTVTLTTFDDLGGLADAPASFDATTDLPGSYGLAADGEFTGVDEDTPVWSVTTSDDGTNAVPFYAGIRVVFDANNTANQGANLNLSALNYTIAQVVKAP